MILIGDCGSTKCDWVFVSDQREREFTTKGINPVFHTSEDISDLLRKSELSEVANEVKKVFFYGAGCSSNERRQVVYRALSSFFSSAELTVDHDLTACAFSTYEHEPSISCILGTGSNSCYYDGYSLIQSVPSLGYILGDEGSGTYLGKKVLSDYLYQRMPEHLQITFSRRYALSKDDILANVYSKPDTNVFLASFTPFLVEHQLESYVQGIIASAFRHFLRIHVLSYEQYTSCKTHFIGSIAYLFQSQLIQVCTEMGINTGRIIQKPIDGLVKYHLRNF
jgi:glucosamine kinase